MSATAFPSRSAAALRLRSASRASVFRWAVWSPVLVAVVYMAILLVRLPQIIKHLYWDSDGAVAALIAQSFGHGHVSVLHYGWFATLWLAELTRPLPFHRSLWEYGPYVGFLVMMGLLVWATHKLAGRWAAAMTAVAAICTSPFVTYVSASMNFHTNAWVGVAVCAAYVCWVTNTPNDGRAAVVSVVAALFMGTEYASDPLFGFVALAPLVVAAVATLLFSGQRWRGALMASVAVASVPISWVTVQVMSGLHYDVRSQSTAFASSDLWSSNFHRLLSLIFRLGNGNYFTEQPQSWRSGFYAICSALMIVATISPFVALGRELFAGRTKRSSARFIYAAFWSSSVLILALAYTLSTVGTHPGYYLISILYAGAATAPIAWARNGTNLGRAVVALGVGLVAFTSTAVIANQATAFDSGLPEITKYINQIEATAVAAHATNGYGDYWDAPSATWSTTMRLNIRQVQACSTSVRASLCPFGVNVNSAWFTPQPGNSFILQDKASIYMKQAPPVMFGAPSAIYTFGPDFVMYVYPYDVASRIDYSDTFWGNHPTV